MLTGIGLRFRMKLSITTRIMKSPLPIPNNSPVYPAGREEVEDARILQVEEEDKPTTIREMVHLLREAEASLKSGAQPALCPLSNRLSSNTRAGMWHSKMTKATEDPLLLIAKGVGTIGNRTRMRKALSTSAYLLPGTLFRPPTREHHT